MGHVWLARDERNGLDVALKMVVREGRVAERAEREARAAAALRHPRCQRIYALARDSSHIYIAYEYVPGRTLRHALDARELTDEEAVEAAAQVLDALAHAHRKGIVHRDVKPSNVLLAESDGIDMRLLDFGLAQMAEFDTLTAVGDVPGTLTYVSPERLAGETATAAADVWGVGVMLWEALGGRHPFRSSSAAGTSRRIRAGPRRSRRFGRISGSGARRGRERARPGPGEAAFCRQARSRAARGPRKRKRLPGEREKRAGAELPGARVCSGSRRSASLLPSPPRLGRGGSPRSLPFYPAGWPLGLTIAAAALGFAFPRAAFAFALTVTFFPLANISLGLAALFAVLGAAWIALTWRDPRGNIVLVLAPLLGPLAGLALLPIAAQFARGPTRRAVQAAAGALLAVLVAGLRHQKLPFAGVTAPLGLGITGSNRPTAVAFALWRPLEAHPVVLGQAVVLAAAAVALPYLRGRGPWIAAGAGAGLLAATALGAPEASLLPLAAAAWITAAFLIGTSPATTPPAAVSTSERSGPTRKRDSLLRRRETVPTFSPEGL